jgi:UDP:flavonoid glycosyltransferase YjiC (YdhE family)
VDNGASGLVEGSGMARFLVTSMPFSGHVAPMAAVAAALRPTLEALAGADALVVASTGVRGQDTLPFPVPPNVRTAAMLPFDELFPRIETLVSNGGWGGVLTALSPACRW